MPRHRRLKAAFLTFTTISLLSGCATLPSSGPTAQEVVRRAESKKEGFRFQIVQLDEDTIAALNAAQRDRAASAVSLAVLSGPPQRRTLGPGDILNISIFEVGVSLFATSGVGPAGSFDPSAHEHKFPETAVSQDGTITLPYVGTLSVSGETPEAVERQIDQRLAGKSQQPRAMVILAQNVSNTFIVGGDVRKPGRYDLTFNRERLLDALAIAGGATSSFEDTLVRFERDGRSVEQRLSTVRAASKDDLLVQPNDYLQFVNRPRSFTIFGAAGKVSQIEFNAASLSLAEALARAEGPSDGRADPKAVFIFRYDESFDPASGTKPVIYRIDMRDPASYFLMQHFAMQDKDVIYVANAAANQPSKLINIINQLFSPFVTAKVLTNF